MLLLAAALAFTALPSGVRDILVRSGVNEAAFPAFVQQIDDATRRREKEGEYEHLVFFVLQSETFTRLPLIEPALSAKEWKASNQIPAVVRKRVQAFLSSPAQGTRMRYLREIMPKSGAFDFVLREYVRTMDNLYSKEFNRAPDFYQTRGHSTDTSVAANYAVWSALRVLRAMHPDLRLERVLVIGPGLDFAPRTGLDERFEPQSYQPFALADALLGLGLARRPVVECIDLNARVVRYFHDLHLRSKAVLHLSTMPGDPEYTSYFTSLGQNIGRTEGSGLEKLIVIGPEHLAQVSAANGNVITGRLRAARYDLVVATNVLVYLKDLELLLALANISSTLKPGGFFVTNETRPVVDAYSVAVGLAPVQARTLRIAHGKTAPLYDTFAIFSR